jgi:GNAT superfamily N-acetyltransferase
LVPRDDERRFRRPAQGIGGRLLEPLLELADRARVDCYLDTADRANVDFYKRHGFAVDTRCLTARPTLQCDGVHG